MPERACPSAEQLQAYAVGQLPDDASDEIAEHLDRCESCQACLTTLDNAEDTLVSRLKQSSQPDAIVAEPECQAALSLACSLASGTPGAPVSDQHVPVRAGQQLGEYRLLEELGSGGMGRVYKALQTKLDRLVALKILPTARAEDRRAITRFEREMKAIGRLEHPNIVRAYDAREIDGRPVLVTDCTRQRTGTLDPRM